MRLDAIIESRWQVRFVFGLVLSLWFWVGHVYGAPASGSSGPSFPCPGNTQIERAICDDAGLSAYDRQMARLYAAARQTGFKGAAAHQLMLQRDWLTERDKRCSKDLKLLNTCLKGLYQGRVEQLARAAFLTAPEEAFAALQDADPKTAPMYKAMALYATIDNPEKRAKAILPLIKPYYDRHGGDGSYAGMRTLGDVLASDNNFGQFVSWTWLKGDYLQIDWPCGVLARRPALIDNMGPLWGGYIDVVIPGSDCRDTGPVVPGLTQVILSALSTAPACDGTIRFTAGRAFEQLETAVRLYRPSIWSKHPLSKPKSEEKAFRIKQAALILKTKTELAAYYREQFTLSPRLANRDATDAIDHLIYSAFSFCE
jgi:uncharacterized protein